ncbi:MAG: hypothetical protein PSV36_19035 [Algoriphagus sp.]|nr:hypothetical protein [Algoriphagus sp.]
MEGFDNLAIELLEMEQSLEYVPKIPYTISGFKKELRNSKHYDIDWIERIENQKKKIINIRLLDASLWPLLGKKNYPDLFDIPFDTDESDFESQSSEYLDPQQKSENKEINSDVSDLFIDREKWVKSQRSSILDGVEKLLNEILNFYNIVKDQDPYKIPRRKEDKIPFMGDMKELSAFLYLLNNTNSLFGTWNLKMKPGWPISEVHSKVIKKEKLISILMNSFYCLNVDDGKVEEIDLTRDFLYRKMTYTLLTELSLEKLIEMQTIFKKIDEELKGIIKKKSEPKLSKEEKKMKKNKT